MDPRISLLNDANTYIDYVNNLTAIIDSTHNSINQESTFDQNDNIKQLFTQLKNNLSSLRNDITLVSLTNRFPSSENKSSKLKPFTSLFKKTKSSKETTEPKSSALAADSLKLTTYIAQYNKSYETFIAQFKFIIKHVEKAISESISEHDMATKLAADMPEEKLAMLSKKLTDSKSKERKIGYFDLQKQAKSTKHNAFDLYKSFKALANKIYQGLNDPTNLNLNVVSDIRELFKLQKILFQMLDVVKAYNKFINKVEAKKVMMRRDKHFAEDIINPSKKEIVASNIVNDNSSASRSRSDSLNPENNSTSTMIKRP